MYKPALVAGIIFAGLGVILGAFGAHALKQVLDAAQLQTFETGVRYQMYHSFALLAAGILYGHFPVKAVRLAATFFIIGILGFSGSLYALALLQMQGIVGLGGVGIITPIGGLMMIIGWLMLLAGVLKKG
jgi:uncharacterized membrane protein YgdD (TMEM256/DUF423 family)